MKHCIALCLMVLVCLSMWGQKAEDILKSKDVIAYSVGTSAYLMDVNTGKEVQMPIDDYTTQFIWDKTGTRLFRTYLDDDYFSGKSTFLFTEIKLPSLTEEIIINVPVDGFVVRKVEAVIAEDGNLYLYELMAEYDEYDDQIGHNWYVTYYYNLTNNKLEELAEGQRSPADYLTPYSRKIVTENDKITNRLVLKPEPEHYELFTISNPKAAEPTYKQLTTFKPKAGVYNILNQKNEFWVAPNDSLIVFSYHYYISDPGGDFGYTQVISKDGKKSMFISDISPLQQMQDIAWTNNSRLIFCQKVTQPEEKKAMVVLNKNWTVKTLKTFNNDSYPNIYYRYKK